MIRDVFQVASRYKYKFILGGLLIAASLISVVLLKVHTFINGFNNYRFLDFNLFLSWIPLWAAVVAYGAARNRTTLFLILPVSALIWLVFFPNAPYLLTDFQHLAYATGRSPLWFDVILFIWFAWTGLLLGITSLYLMQEIVTNALNRLAGWIFAIGVTILSSIGVYLGRFLDWNSWDLLHHPLPIVKDMYGVLRNPGSNLAIYVFTISFTLLFLFIYLAIHLFANDVRDRRDSGSSKEA